MIALIQEKLPRYVDAKPFEIQVLTPMRKGTSGSRAAEPDPAEIPESAGRREIREGGWRPAVPHRGQGHADQK